MPKLSCCSFLEQAESVAFYEDSAAVFLSSLMTFKLWAIFMLFQCGVLNVQQCCEVFSMRARLIPRVLAAEGDSLIFTVTEDNPLWHGRYTEKSCESEM